jgi:hypothetical protein
MASIAPAPAAGAAPAPVVPFDADTLSSAVERLIAALPSGSRICVIGSAPGIMSGQEGRVTPDIDIWWPLCSVDAPKLLAAAKVAGLRFGGREDDPVPGYLQIVTPGVVSAPHGCPTVALRSNMEGTSVVMPAPAALVAMKLARGREADLEDCTWWVASRGLSMAEVKTQINALPRVDRITATENLPLLQVMVQQKRREQQRPSVRLG